MPDAFVFPLLATLFVIVAGVVFTPSTLPQVIDAWGRGLWELIPFTLQMALIIITGHVLAASRPIGRIIRRVATWPTTPRNAVALVAFFAMASSWSIGIQPYLQRGARARSRAARRGRRLSSARRRQLPRSRERLGAGVERIGCPANGDARALQPQIRAIVANNGMIPSGLIPFGHTIFLWQSLLSVTVRLLW